MDKRQIHVVTSARTCNLRRVARVIKKAGDGLMIVPLAHMDAAVKALVDVGAERGGVTSLAGTRRRTV